MKKPPLLDSYALGQHGLVNSKDRLAHFRGSWPPEEQKSFPLWQLGVAGVIPTRSRKETCSSGSLFLEACLIFKKCPVTPLRGHPSFQHCLMLSAGSERFGNASLGVMNLSMISTGVSPQKNLAWSLWLETRWNFQAQLQAPKNFWLFH